MLPACGHRDTGLYSASLQSQDRTCAGGGLTVGVKHFTGEPHLRWTQRIIRRKTEDGRKHSTFKTRVLRTPETQRAERGSLTRRTPSNTKQMYKQAK